MYSCESDMYLEQNSGAIDQANYRGVRVCLVRYSFETVIVQRWLFLIDATARAHAVKFERVFFTFDCSIAHTINTDTRVLPMRPIVHASIVK
jgi:hypothetical protein